MWWDRQGSRRNSKLTTGLSHRVIYNQLRAGGRRTNVIAIQMNTLTTIGRIIATNIRVITMITTTLDHRAVLSGWIDIIVR